MAKKNEAQKQDNDGVTQDDLFNKAPENAKKILGLARKYKSAQLDRIAALEEELKFKEALLAEIKGADLSRMEDGKIKLHLDGYTITVTPRDELIRVKEDGDEEK
ncbi:MAG TPA: hypothetical protein PLD93_03185 [Synergistaceae bacterium]|nr:hypothetical protein [Synergistaceae bacterium]